MPTATKNTATKRSRIGRTSRPTTPDAPDSATKRAGEKRTESHRVAELPCEQRACEAEDRRSRPPGLVSAERDHAAHRAGKRSASDDRRTPGRRGTHHETRETQCRERVPEATGVRIARSTIASTSSAISTLKHQVPPRALDLLLLEGLRMMVVIEIAIMPPANRLSNGPQPNSLLVAKRARSSRWSSSSADDSGARRELREAPQRELQAEREHQQHTHPARRALRPCAGPRRGIGMGAR